MKTHCTKLKIYGLVHLINKTYLVGRFAGAAQEAWKGEVNQENVKCGNGLNEILML